MTWSPREVYVGRGTYHLASWLSLSAFCLGLFALWSGESSIVPIIMGAGYLGLFVTFRAAVAASRDIFNPLSCLLFIAFVRYGLQGVLLALGVEPPDGIAGFYQRMGLSASDWLWGHVMALTSLAGVALGWLAVRGQSSKPSWLRFSFAPAVRHAALLGMFVGFAALTLFIVKNASLAAVLTGAMRSTTIQEGTGVYYRLSFMLIAGSILFSGYLMERNKIRSAYIPVLICVLPLFTLGGRGTAIVPFLAVLLLHWYRRREQKGWPALSFKLAHIVIFVLSFVAATWVFYFGALYRGGYGVDALQLSLSLDGMWQYLWSALFSEFGSLHSLAGAVAVGPGVLGGDTFFGTLSWPFSKFLPIPGRSAGVYIVETLVGFSTARRWGLHPSLMGDAYLNFGVFGILIIMPLFGILIRLLYLKFRTGKVNSALYAFAAVYSVSLFTKSIDAWPNLLMGMIFMLVTLRFADFLDFPRRRLRAAYPVGIASMRNR